MLRYLTYRILASIPVLFVMSVITFIIIHSTPGDYADYVRMKWRWRRLSNSERTMASMIR
jgi:ABC-type dipeptide/oligopeptide/nickel transport system permease component